MLGEELEHAAMRQMEALVDKIGIQLVKAFVSDLPTVHRHLISP